MKGRHAGLRVPGTCSLCLAWPSPQPQPSTCPGPGAGGGVVIVCWRRGQGTLTSSKGPPLPKPTYPAATSALEGPAPRGPLWQTPSDSPGGGPQISPPDSRSPQPTLPSEGNLDTSLPLGPQLPHHVHLASNWQPLLTPAISDEGPFAERPQV